MQLRLEDARGKCYGRIATMSGHQTGVATRMKLINQKCLYTHCYGHALNLAVGDTIRGINTLSETFNVIREIWLRNLLQGRRYVLKVTSGSPPINESKGIHAFCPTRWTVRGEGCIAMINNHQELCSLWEWLLNNLTDTQMKARVIGVQAYMNKYVFVFGCLLSKNILQRTDNLSRVLQSSTITAAKGSALAEVSELVNERSDEGFQIF